jgi:hypothetical protein
MSRMINNDMGQKNLAAHIARSASVEWNLLNDGAEECASDWPDYQEEGQDAEHGSQN